MNNANAYLDGCAAFYAARPEPAVQSLTLPLPVSANRYWTEGTGGETALADCKALIPGVLARADNLDALTALLRACESEDAQQVRDALALFAEIMP